MPPEQKIATRVSAPASLANLPKGFAALASKPVEATPSDAAFDAYIWFASPKSKQWGEMAAKLPGLVDGDTVFVSPKLTEIVRVMKYHLMTVEQYWAVKHPTTGQPMKGVVFTEDRAKEEYIDSVILVQTSAGLLPARCRFKSGLIGAVNDAISELKLVSSDLNAWASRSAMHAAAAKAPIPAPGMRFLVTASFASRTSKKTGSPYMLGRAQIAPTSPEDAKLFAGLAEADVAALCELVAGEHEKRMNAIRALPAN